MSRVSSKIMIFIGIALLATQVSAHGHLSTPTSREYMFDYATQDFPASFPLASDFVCKNQPVMPSSMWTTLTSGQPSTISWNFAAPHPGDCFAYISYDINVTDTEKKWFKIASFRDCNLVNNIPQILNVPSNLPSCDHCILRWEWYALHLQAIGSVEFYSQCADIKIVGKSNGVLPSPLVTIPGHIPMGADSYRNPYGADAATGALIGPPIATEGGASYNCTDRYGSTCTAAPAPVGECAISSQQCVTSSTYKACGIGRTSTEWYAPQSCQTGLVCVNIKTIQGDRINCVRPSDVPSSSSSSSSSSGSSYSYSTSTTAATKPISATTAAATKPVPSTTAAATKPIAATTGSPIVVSATTASPVAATSASPVTPAPVTPAPVTPTPVPVIPPSSCTQGNMKCLTSETYSTCDRGQWGVSQSCRIGLTCSPAGNYIYCL